MKNTSAIIEIWRPLMLKIFHDFSQPLGTLTALWPSLVSPGEELGDAAKQALDDGVHSLVQWRNLWSQTTLSFPTLQAFFAPHITFQGETHFSVWDGWVLWSTLMYLKDMDATLSNVTLSLTTVQTVVTRPLTHDSFIFPLWQALTHKTYTLTQDTTGTYLKKL